MNVLKKMAIYSLTLFVLALAGCQSPPEVASKKVVLEKVQTSPEEANKLAARKMQEAKAAKLAEQKQRFARQADDLVEQMPADLVVVDRGGEINVVLSANSQGVPGEIIAQEHFKITFWGGKGFASGQSGVSGPMVELLNKIAKSIVINRNELVVINAHTDSDGSADFNLALSKKRALAAAKYLFEQGVPQEHLVVNGYGESQPLVSNDTKAGRDKNRRVELVILPAGSVEPSAPTAAPSVAPAASAAARTYPIKG